VSGGTSAEHSVPDGLATEHQAAAEFAHRAGEVLLELRTRSSPGKALGQAGDRLSHDLLIQAIADLFPADRVRSEEEAPGAEAPEPGGGRLWIVDPLDGTREYSEGRDDWAVHVALTFDGEPSVGAVALPALDVVIDTARPVPLTSPAAVPRILVSRTRPPQFMAALVERLGATTVPMGSAGAKIAAVIRGQGEIYVHAGGQYEWDSAAPVAVALANGLHASRIDGSPLRYGRPNPWLPDILVCHRSLAEPTLAALDGLIVTEGDAS
jgi:3'(2'), 5'-bisphosphate nucleotidase